MAEEVSESIESVVITESDPLVNVILGEDEVTIIESEAEGAVILLEADPVVHTVIGESDLIITESDPITNTVIGEDGEITVIESISLGPQGPRGPAGENGIGTMSDLMMWAIVFGA